MYWQQETDVFNCAVADLLSRNRFEEILRYSHLAGNAKLAPGDKLAKVRSFFNLMNQRFLNAFQYDEQLCVDESMIPYFGKHSAKQYIKGKPINFGYKVWCLNTNNGYLIQCDPYSGKGDYNPKLGLRGSVVTKLIRKLPSDFKFNVTFDNLFTSLNLLKMLAENGIGETGTLRVNRTGKFPIKDNKAIGKESRGTYDFRYDSANKILVVRWNGNSVETLASNYQPLHPVGTSKRYSRSEKKMLDIPEPSLVKYYNKNMGGVDRMDQNIAYYRIQLEKMVGSVFYVYARGCRSKFLAFV